MHSHLFAGTRTLARFILRRDRIRLSVWLLSFTFFLVLLVPVFENLLAGHMGNAVMAEMMKNPAMIAIAGPVYGADHYTTGAAYANTMLVFSAMIGATLNIFLITRHTRQDEELGRLEVIRSLPVGRLANLAAALILAVGINAALALLSGIGLFLLREAGMDFTGSMLFGAALGSIGFFFAASTAIFCQLTANSRTATALSFLFMFLLYILRAVGDMGMEVLSLISPLGLVLRIQSFVNNYWWPIWILLGLSALLCLAAFVLARMRDLGRGLVPEHPGRPHAQSWLSGPYGLAFKLTRTASFLWAMTLFILAAMYGSVFGELERFLESSEMIKAIFSQNPQYSLTEQFTVLLMTIMTLIGVIPVLSLVGRIGSEERCGHTEHLLSRGVSRHAQMAAYVFWAFVWSILFQGLSALGFWSMGSMVLETAPTLRMFLLSALSYLPAMWVFIGISLVLTAYLPRFTALSYVYVGYTFFSVYLGTLANLPEWLQKLTPFGYIPQYPLEEMSLLPLAVLSVIAISLSILGFWGYRRRDMLTQ